MQLAIAPPGATLAGPFLWRLSSARVAQDGPFSRFPGYRRRLALLAGAGLDLAFEDGTVQALDDPRRPLTFEGHVGVQATLRDGACVDVGVIYDPARVTAALTVVPPGPGTFPLAPQGTTLVWSPSDRAEVAGFALGPGEALRWDGPGPGHLAHLDGKGDLVVLRIDPLPAPEA